jgi:elongation factor Ts
MAVSATLVKELREKTGAGMMDCQRALTEANGDLEEAVKILRKKGLSAAAKKAGRAAKDGLVAVAIASDRRQGALVELNCETDFVARTERYQTFAQTLAEQAMAEGWSDAAAGLKQPLAGDPEHTVAQAIAGQIATIGENILLSRAASLAASEGMRLGSYLHMGGKIGVLVEVSLGASEETVKDVAMHVAAAEPRFTSRETVPANVVDEEREIARAQAAALGKPPAVADKIAEGKLGKFFEQVCLVEQPFVKNPEEKVGAMLTSRGGATVARFLRFKLGEGGVAGVE